MMGIDRRTLRGLLVVALMLAALAAHVVYWYQARARLGTPSPDGLATRLLLSQEFEVSLWVPYPHQNLAHLQNQTGTGSRALAAMARIAGLPQPDLPAFGSMGVPPASEIALATSDDGDRFALCARVYPAFAAFAKLSGQLAGNPWLSGGEIYRDGQRIEVRWIDSWWVVASPGFDTLDKPDPSVLEGLEPSLAVLQVRESPEPLPAGRYLLRNFDGAHELVTERPPEGPSPFDAPQLSALEVFLLALEADAADPQALAFFATPASQLPELPRAAAIGRTRGGAERWELPGESLLELSGRKPRQQTVEPWEVTALDSVSLEAGLRAVPAIEALTAGGPAGDLTWGLWFDLEAGLAEVSRLVRMLSEVPLVPESQLQRWRDIETVLESLSSHTARLEMAITDDGAGGVRLRLRFVPTPPFSP